MGHKQTHLCGPQLMKVEGTCPTSSSLTPLLVDQILHLARALPGSLRRGRGAKLPDFYKGLYQS